MSKARNIADLLNSSGDVKLAALDNAPAPTKATVDALGIAATSVTGSQASAITANTAKITYPSADSSKLSGVEAGATADQTKADIDALGLNAAQLDAIAATKSVTAVDVFVYDTSKDSDGGAWRKRTQGTSWYNEALNTATRGSRKEFPAVAVIVAETAKVTIYDGDDPSMPMWMVFNATSTSGWLYIYTLNRVAALNGKLITAQSSNSCEIDFITDDNLFRQNGSSGHYNGTISQRNAGLSYTNSSHTQDIVNGTVNDIAMTVLPNAPIDSATGLPIPTIAVATNGGVSVIKDDGSVVDIVHATQTISANVRFSDSNKVVYTVASTLGAQHYVHTKPIPSADIADDVGYVKGASTAFYNDTATSADLYIAPKSTAIKDVVEGAVGTALNLALLKENLTTPSKGSVAYITSDYNTGYMVGDIKLAALSDTDDTDVVGSELVTNGTFASDVSGWTAYNSVVTYSGGTIKVDDSANVGGNSSAQQVISGLVVGQSYILSGEIISTNGHARIVGWQVGEATDSTNNASVILVPSVSVSFTGGVEFVPTGTSITIGLVSDGDGIAYFDNISVRLADSDRSVNANGLAVHGTITKTAVATGADLVGYSGFSTSNFLVQPYISDLDFGTGDFSIMGWIKVGSNVSTYASILSRVLSTNTATNAWSLRIDSSANNYYFYTNNTSVFTSPLTRSTWQFLTVARRSGVVYFYVNGILRTTGPMANSITNVGASVVVGYEASHHLGNSSAALFRISATAPSAQQIKDIYEAERPLFQENAQATLYGTSDAVTALAHDDTTNLLHVGTSSGRSVFQGLQRVDNTTSAVGSAISASNNLVVED